MEKKRVLIITYYWPPAGGAGVQRWLKMAKYLALNNVEVTIYTPENPEAPQDPSLLKDIPSQINILKQPIWEPYSLLNFFKGKKTNHSNYLPTKKSLVSNIMTWIRGNVFIPDPRCFWIKPSINFLNQYLEKNPIENIITTGPPHSMHLIGLGLKEKNPSLNWIADFRDPWTFIDFFDQLNMTSHTKKKHQSLEKNVILTANNVVTVSKSWATKYQDLYKKEITLIQNGYDPADFEINKKLEIKKHTIRYFGSMNADRNPILLWESISDLLKQNNNLKSSVKIEFYGMINESIISSIKEHNLFENSIFHSYIPHQEAVEKMLESHILLLVLNNTSNQDGIIPGKIFEYLGCQRPILCMGNTKGDGAEVIQDSGNGKCFEFNGNKTEIKQFILDCFEEKFTLSSSNFEHYSRKNQALAYQKLLK